MLYIILIFPATKESYLQLCESQLQEGCSTPVW